jgi:UPF0042 nucleotide-binding protein
VQLEHQHSASKVAIAMDVRSADSLPLVPAQLAHLRALDVNIRLLFLDATTEILVHRFSETRRRHPLSRQDGQDVIRDQQRDLVEAIELERELLSELREESHIIDTSLIRSSKLQSYIKSRISAPATQLTLMFESFAFKRGIPLHADYVFDVRMLPNPHYESALRPLTGRDAPVAEWLAEHGAVEKMASQITDFLNTWLPDLNQDHRSYVTVAIGCTGGQHRSVYLVELLSKAFAQEWVTLKRHRELDLNA